MCHSTKRLYFPDVVEPESQYDKYPIVKYPIPYPNPKKQESKTLRQHYDEYVAQKRLEQPFFDAWLDFIAQKRDNYYHGL